MRCIFLLLFVIGFQSISGQTSKDYVLYHLQIIDAEQEIFLNKNPKKGLEIFNQTFNSYDFAFVDDCIEAFQIALVYQRDDYALNFIKKAINNGLELKLLSRLNYSCPCNLYKNEDSSQVVVFNSFLAKYRIELEEYSKNSYLKYIGRLNKDLFYNIIKRHVKEQIHKNYIPGLTTSIKEQDNLYYAINNDNIFYIDSLFSQGIFLGEKNLGIYSDKLFASFSLPYYTIQHYLAAMLRSYGLSTTTYVPIVGEEAYFEASPLYIMLYHKRGSYYILKKYSEQAIKLGYLHPRELARLKFNFEKDTSFNAPLYLSPGYKNINKHDLANIARNKEILPSLEIDSAKHEFAHKHHLQLFFGFNNSSR